MCYSGTCPFELWSGECGKRKSQGPCPETFETFEEYHEYMEQQADDYGDYLYEQQRDQDIFG